MEVSINGGDIWFHTIMEREKEMLNLSHLRLIDKFIFQVGMFHFGSEYIAVSRNKVLLSARQRI